MAAGMSASQPVVPLAEAARARGALRRVWEAPGAPVLLLAELRDVRFWIAPGLDGAIFVDDATAVEESLRFLKPVNAPGRGRGRVVRAPRAEELLGDFDEVLLPVDPGWMNYFHWLLVHVPALRAADAWLDPAVPAALPRHADHLGVPRPVSFAAAVMEESLAGLARPLRALAPGAYRARRLYRFVVEAPLQADGIRCAPWWEALLGLAERLRAADAGAAAGPPRIFVSRRGARRRLLAAEEDAAFQAALAAAGFVAPTLAGRGLAEQARAFRGARCVVGPHGSGLANLLFCAPGSAVLELNAAVAGEAAPRPHFRRLAERRGLDYGELRLEDAADGARLAAELRRWLEART
jgi:hypothetical protein